MFFVWCVPTLWAVCSLVQWEFPGDELIHYGLASLPGIWVLLLVDVDPLPDPWFRVWILSAGVLVMGGLGWAMDRLHLTKRQWLMTAGVAVLTVATAIAFLAESSARGLKATENQMVILPLALQISVVLSLLGKGGSWCWRRLRAADRNQQTPSTD